MATRTHNETLSVKDWPPLNLKIIKAVWDHLHIYTVMFGLCGGGVDPSAGHETELNGKKSSCYLLETQTRNSTVAETKGRHAKLGRNA